MQFFLSTFSSIGTLKNYIKLSLNVQFTISILSIIIPSSMLRGYMHLKISSEKKNKKKRTTKWS